MIGYEHVFVISVNILIFFFSKLLVGVREFLTNWTMQQGPAFLASLPQSMPAI